MSRKVFCDMCDEEIEFRLEDYRKEFIDKLLISKRAILSDEIFYNEKLLCYSCSKKVLQFIKKKGLML